MLVYCFGKMSGVLYSVWFPSKTALTGKLMSYPNRRGEEEEQGERLEREASSSFVTEGA